MKSTPDNFSSFLSKNPFFSFERPIDFFEQSIVKIQSFQCNIPIPDLKISIQTKSDEQNKRFMSFCTGRSLLKPKLFFSLKKCGGFKNAKIKNLSHRKSFKLYYLPNLCNKILIFLKIKAPHFFNVGDTLKLHFLFESLSLIVNSGDQIFYHFVF